MANKLKLHLFVVVEYDDFSVNPKDKAVLVDNLKRLIQAAHADDSLIRGTPVDVEQVQFTVAEVL